MFDQIIQIRKKFKPKFILASMAYHPSPEVVLINAAGPVQPGVSCQGRATPSVSGRGHEADAWYTLQ